MRTFATSLSIALIAITSACRPGTRTAMPSADETEPRGTAKAPVVGGAARLACQSSRDCRQVAPPSCSGLDDQFCQCTGRDVDGRCKVSKCVWQVEPASFACVLRH